MTDGLCALEEFAVDNGLVDAFVQLIVVGHTQGLIDACLGERLLRLDAAPADHADVYLVGEDAVDAARSPAAALLSYGHAHVLEAVGDACHADAVVGIPVEDLPHHSGLLRVDLQRVALVALDLDLAVAVGGAGADVFALAHGLHAPGLNASVDGLILAAAHK